MRKAVVKPCFAYSALFQRGFRLDEESRRTQYADEAMIRMMGAILLSSGAFGRCHTASCKSKMLQATQLQCTYSAPEPHCTAIKTASWPYQSHMGPSSQLPFLQFPALYRHRRHVSSVMAGRDASRLAASHWPALASSQGPRRTSKPTRTTTLVAPF